MVPLSICRHGQKDDNSQMTQNFVLFAEDLDSAPPVLTQVCPISPPPLQTCWVNTAVPTYSSGLGYKHQDKHVDSASSLGGVSQ